MAIKSAASRDSASPELSPQAKPAPKPSGAHEGAQAPSPSREKSQISSTSRAKLNLPLPPALDRNATDDEILGLASASVIPHPSASSANQREGSADGLVAPDASTISPGAEPEELRAAFDANPELRAAWHDANAYRETFASPEAARAATALLADLDRMDALFFSQRPEDHAELARAVAALDPAAFTSLAHAMAQLAPGNTTGVLAGQPAAPALAPDSVAAARANPPATSAPTPAQMEFFHAANAAAVQGVIDSIESQVARLLPENISKSARARVVGEIYRELDAALRSNRELAQQMRGAFRSGSLDEAHQRAIVSLITGRARQALPGVAKRVLHEWTSTLVAANDERRTRQRSAERRVDISGSGGSANDGRRSMGPRDIDYARLSDADILNL